MNRLRGLILGWYHQRNAGDDWIGRCIELWLNDHELIFMSHDSTPPADVLEQVDYVLIGGGSIANRAHGAFRNMAAWIGACRLPVFTVGLGVGEQGEMAGELPAIERSGGALWVRDQRSAQLTGCSPSNVFVGPDLSWLFPLCLGPRHESDAVAVNMRPCDWRDWSPEDWADALQQYRAESAPWPLCFGPDDDRSFLTKMLGKAVDIDYFDPTLPRRSRCVIAMRFHAILFAIQSGTPFIAIDHATKVRRFLDDNGLNDYSLSLAEPSRLQSVMDRSIHELTDARLSEITSRLRDNAWQIANNFRFRIEDRVTHSKRKRRHLGTRLMRRLVRRA